MAEDQKQDVLVGSSARNAKRKRWNRNLRALKSTIAHFCFTREGNVLVMFGIGLPAVLIGSAAAISFATEHGVTTDLQNALDAAVLAGAQEIGSGEPSRAAERVFLASLTKKANSLSDEVRTTFTVDNDTLNGTVTGNVSNVFGSLIGSPEYAVTVRSAAKKHRVPVCVLGLNEFDKGSFDVNGNPTFNASCAVQANSTNNSGMTQEGNAPVRAARFGVSGKQKTNNFNPPPETGTAQVADPFASLPFPEYDSCARNAKGLEIKDAADLNPGTYCGGVTVSGANVTLNPGIYVMNGGPFLVKGGGAVTGSNVMIGFTGGDSTLRLWGNSAMTLTAPTSGTYANMQFLVDRSSEAVQHAWVSIGGSDGNPDGTPKLTYDGVAYFGKQNFWVYGNAIVNGNSANYAVVADKIWLQGRASLTLTNNNSRGLTVPKAQEVGSASVRLLR